MTKQYSNLIWSYIPVFINTSHGVTEGWNKNQTSDSPPYVFICNDVSQSAISYQTQHENYREFNQPR